MKFEGGREISRRANEKIEIFISTILGRKKTFLGALEVDPGDSGLKTPPLWSEMTGIIYFSYYSRSVSFFAKLFIRWAEF